MEEIMELFNYYSLDECVNRKQVMSKLRSLESEDKIEYSLDQEILKIKDLYLEENEVIELCELFEKNDVFPYMDKEDEDDFYGVYDDYDYKEDEDEY
jgi:hypothetical protein